MTINEENMVKKASSKEKIPIIEPIPPSSLFDSIEITDDVDFTDPHSLKKVLMKKS